MAATRAHEYFRARLIRNYDRTMHALERRGLGEARARLLGKARGRVLDVGAGTGANFTRYGSATQSVVAVDAEIGMLAQGRRRAAEAVVPVMLVVGTAESLPFADASFDTIVATLVFCTVADPDRALEEVLRVLAPGGRVLMLEHVRPRNAVLGSLADLLTPLQRLVAAGCHLNRRTHAAVVRSGLHVDAVRARFGGAVVQIEAMRPTTA